MPPNSPENYSLATYLWVLVLSILGGSVRTFARMAEGVPTPVRWVTMWVIDVISSAFIGLITFFLCQYAQCDPMLTIAMVGVSAHMGTRALIAIQRRVFSAILSDIADKPLGGDKDAKV